MAALLAAATVLSGCATLRQLAPGAEREPGPEEEFRAGVAALRAGDFASARGRLAPLTGGCLDAPVERRAALLLASAELDPTNPDGIPRTAAALAARVFVRSPAGEADAALARSLYVMALDRGADPPGTVVDPACAPSPAGATAELPSPADPTTADRLTALADSLAARGDSIAALRARASAAEERARALEQELERIRQLLRGGAGPRR